jgi:hypothetical protein
MPPSWTKNIQALMEIAQKSGRITDKELEEGKGQAIVFYKEGDPRPAPRPTIRAPRVRNGTDDEADGWVPTN